MNLVLSFLVSVFIFCITTIRLPFLVKSCLKQIIKSKGARANILFLVVGEPRRGLAPSSRFRAYQYIPYLEKMEFNCVVRPSRPSKYFMAGYSFKRINKNHPSIGKIWKRLNLLLMKINRIWDIFESRFFDIVFLQKDLFPGPSPKFEEFLCKINPNVVFDFDDAIYLTTPWDKSFNGCSLRYPLIERKISKIVSLSSRVVVANKYLEKFALQYNSKVKIINTPIDINFYIPRSEEKDSRLVVIGWIGTSDNLYYLKQLIPVFKKLSNLEVVFRVVCNKTINDELRDLKIPKLEYKEWSLDTELKELQAIDIGVMPLNDDAWAKGKSGLKILQYMAMGIPVVCSPIGFNLEIVRDGVNGFFANSNEEWREKLSLLVKDRNLRQKMGKQAREIVKKNYSTEIHSLRLASIFRELINKNKR